MTDSCIQQILGKISAEGILLKGPLLLAEMTCGHDVEDAVMYDPGNGGCEDLFLSSSMGFDDIDGMADSAEISRTENSEPLVELAFPAEPDDFLMLSEVSGDELDRVMCAFITQ